MHHMALEAARVSLVKEKNDQLFMHIHYLRRIISLVESLLISELQCRFLRVKRAQQVYTAARSLSLNDSKLWKFICIQPC